VRPRNREHSRNREEPRKTSWDVLIEASQATAEAPFSWVEKPGGPTSAAGGGLRTVTGRSQTQSHARWVLAAGQLRPVKASPHCHRCNRSSLPRMRRQSWFFTGHGPDGSDRVPQRSPRTVSWCGLRERGCSAREHSLAEHTKSRLLRPLTTHEGTDQASYTRKENGPEHPAPDRA
jgi:hypothetical protein